MMTKGVVKRFNDAKGYGFIKASEDGEDVFVHFSAITNMKVYRKLTDGRKAEFDH